MKTMAKLKKASKTQKPTEFNDKAIAVRSFVLQNPTGSVEDLRKYWAKKPSLGKLPDDKQVMSKIYGARTQLRNRYGMDVADIPWQTPGTMVKLVLTNHNKDWGYRQVANYLALDGLVLNDKTFYGARKTFLAEYPEKVAELATSETPDPNQHAGPRAGSRKKKGKVDKVEKTLLAIDAYEGIESDLDNLLRRADNLGDTKLVKDIRAARRRASAKVLQFSN